MAASVSSSEALTAFAVHGGRLGEARRRFSGAPQPWIDLSTGVSPHPYPAPPANPATRARLPDPDEIAGLEAVASEAFGGPSEAVLATAGVEAGLRLLASVLPARRIGVVEPTYGGHAGAWRAVGATVIGLPRRDIDVMAKAFDALVVVNPNNPDGAVTAPERLLALADQMARRDGWLIVDEAFAEVAPEASVLPLMAGGSRAERLIVLRSFGKFYGLPGLRLGFVAARPDLIARLRLRQGEWPVSADAIAAGLAAYPDAAWARAARDRLATAARRLDDLLARAGLDVVGGSSLFRLVDAADAQDRFAALANAGVLTRPFPYNPRWLRFGLPADADWPRLETALMESAR
jgi:cobalamin biosynthetic protein CobC